MDLLFPHHESEIAQSQVAHQQTPVKYWMHNNMITINGQKMGKSLGNFITLEEFFTGSNSILTQPYSPMSIRFFILQAHYRGTIDFSNEALQSAEKGMRRLMAGYETLLRLISRNMETEKPLPPSPLTEGTGRARELKEACYAAMNDDFNSPVLIANLFEGVRIINSAADQKEAISNTELELLKSIFDTFLFDILGLKNEKSNDQSEMMDGMMQLILSIRQKSRETKDWATSDQIRDILQKLNIKVKDGKEGSSWNFE